jgi:4-hydroxybenzoyl-CoA thioesterase
MSAEQPGQRPFTVTRKIRFGQTDPAGIVYYPNYFDMFNEIVEDWFADELDYSFDRMHRLEGFGIPIVTITCDFMAPCRLGESFELSLTVLQLGATSLHLRVSGSVAGQERIKASMVLVFTDMTTYQSVPPPEALRALILRRIIAPVEVTNLKESADGPNTVAAISRGPVYPKH